MNDLLRYKFDDLYFLIFDLETCNLNLKYNLIWQLYFQINKGHQLLESYNFYLDWSKVGMELNVSKDAAKITGFNQEIIDKQGKHPKEILDFFDSYLYNTQYVIIAQNCLGFDSQIHNAWRLILGKQSDYSWLDRLLDTNALSKMYKLNLTKPKDMDNLTWMFQLNEIKIKGLKTSNSTMAKEFEIPFDPLTLHRGEFDVPITFEIFKNLINKIEI